MMRVFYVESHKYALYADCRYAECHGTMPFTSTLVKYLQASRKPTRVEPPYWTPL